MNINESLQYNPSSSALFCVTPAQAPRAVSTSASLRWTCSRPGAQRAVECHVLTRRGSNRDFARFVRETGYVTEAEVFGDSFVLEKFISEAETTKITMMA